jgi:hypothetical protein
LRTVIDGGNALKAIQAVDSRDYRERRRDDGQGVGLHDIRAKQLQLYEDRHGPLSRRSKMLDGDGGLPWSALRQQDPHLAGAIQANYNRRLGELSWVEEKWGVSYKFVPAPALDVWSEVLDSFLESHHGARAAGIDLVGSSPRSTTQEISL